MTEKTESLPGQGGALEDPSREDPALADLSLEELFEKLDHLVENLERRDIPLEEAFRDYQEGIALLAKCSQKIDLVEKKILVMNGDGGFDEFQ